MAVGVDDWFVHQIKGNRAIIRFRERMVFGTGKS
jgi:hypothetical protein